MHSIARLLFGDGPARGNGSGRVEGSGRGEGSDRGAGSDRGDSASASAGGGRFGLEGWGLAERARQAGQWCGSTPGADAITRALGGGDRRGRGRR